MLIKAKPSLTPSPISLYIKVAPLNEVKESRLLGFKIMNNLSWSSHISQLMKKVNSSLKLLYTIRHLIDKATSRHFYYNFIHPHLIHGISMYYPLSPKITLDSLFKCQKKALRAINNVTLKDKVPTALLALITNTLLFTQLALYHSQILASKIHNSQCPIYLKTLFPSHSNRPALRTQDKLPSSATYNKLQLHLTNAFNSLPKCIRQISKINSFKYQVKNRLLMQSSPTAEQSLPPQQQCQRTQLANPTNTHNNQQSQYSPSLLVAQSYFIFQYQVISETDSNNILLYILLYAYTEYCRSNLSSKNNIIFSTIPIIYYYFFSFTYI